MTFVRIHTYSFFYLLNNTCYVYSNCITYLVCLFYVFFNKGMTSTMTVTGLILPVLLHCGILEHPHQDFSMQNKLLKVTDRSYSHLKPPKDVHIIIEQQTYRKNALNPADLQQKHRVDPAAPRGSSLLLLWARVAAHARMPEHTGMLSQSMCCCCCCSGIQTSQGILRHLWIQSVYGHAMWF